MKRALLLFALILLVGCSAAQTAQSPQPPQEAHEAIPVTPAVASSPPAAQPAAPSQAPAPVQPPTAVAAPTPTVSSFAGLTVEQYALGATLPDEGSPLRSSLYAKRAQWHGTVGPQIDQYNRLLAPFGYKITDNEIVYTLYHNDQVVSAALHGLASLSVNARGDDFVLVADTGSGSVLIRPGRAAESWDMPQHEYTAPVFVGNDLITVVRDAAETNTFPGITAFSVWRGDAKAYSTQFTRDKIPNPVKALWAWQGHWVLEVDGDVLIDGKSMKAAQGYDEVFNWHLVAGKPFYFFTKGQKTSAVYDGQVAAEQYDEVPHYRCCSAGAYNAGANQSMVWFYGKRDGQWSYVEMGEYVENLTK
ncbi:MAG: hypothetical protein ACM3XM_10265 [Mycobacterium leprae]